MDYSQYFETKTRKSTQEPFVCLKDEAPQELKDFVQQVHFNHFYKCLPSDWIYSAIWEAFDNLSMDDIDDITIEADPYYSELYKWFGEPFANEFCTECIEEGLIDPKNVYQIIASGQWLAKERIYHAVNDFIQQQKEEIEA